MLKFQPRFREIRGKVRKSGTSISMAQWIDNIKGLTKWNLFCFFVWRLTVEAAFKEFDLPFILQNFQLNRSQDKQSDRSTFIFSLCRLTAGIGDFLP
jgi:hypothetical protein